MIYGIGTDIVEIDRLEQAMLRHPQAFARRTFTEGEQRLADDVVHPQRFYAGRWAAKEAIAKALGVGFGEHCHWLDLDISNDPLGRPILTLKGRAADFAREHGIHHMHLSISHEQRYAVATAIAERSDDA